MSRDGGPAFPEPAVYDPMRDQINPATQYGAAQGMSLRDYFAAHAPHEIVEAITGNCIGSIRQLLGLNEAEQYRAEVHYPAACAKARYVWADAMLAARAKGGAA